MRKLLVTVAALTVLAACGGPATADLDTAAATGNTPRTQPAESPATTSTPATTVGSATTGPTAAVATTAPVPPVAPVATTAPVGPVGPARTPEPGPEPTPAPSRTTRPDCSEVGRVDAVELQRAFDQGRQPWRADPLSVAGAGAACHFGGPASSVEPAGTHRYRATDAVSGEQAVVELTQPLGTGTVWLIAAVTPT